ncbi:AsmA family protein [Methylobacterium radiodurans]|uniref:AsmA family protein n=1 Tax=Methylobacterium radiodurans TaxID=2202828 RepID=A0A2U8VV20_9HYPH|nr:AsmA family protein [Methylobacterium radiodurans]AWN37291.1 AsmA family protein [Methylobacterium radiodurans]
MSPHRLIPALAATALVLGCGAGAMPWSIGTGTALRLLSDELGAYGIGLTADGPATLRLLPLPRLDLHGARLADAAGGLPLAEGGRLSVVLDPVGLLSGRLGIGSLSLDGARLHRPDGPGDTRWEGPLRRVAERARGGWSGHPHRLVLSRAAVAGALALGDLALDIAWPAWRGVAEAQAGFTWRGEAARLTLSELRPAELAGGGASPVAARLVWAGGSLSADGQAQLRPGEPGGLRLAGEGRLETRSLPRLLAALDRDAALLPLAEAFALEGRFETAGAAVMLPRLRVSLGRNVLDGAGSLNLAQPRLTVQATLAAESLDLAPLLAPLAAALGADAPATLVSLTPYTGGDLDLRLSSASARLGPAALEDLAASVLVRDGALEIALNRAGLRGGTLKGRVALAPAAADPAGTEIRAQGSLDRVDLGALLTDLGEASWVQGPVQGHLALESRGRDLSELVARAAGRATLAVERGSLVGLDLTDVIQRNGGLAAGALARRNGRTPFERAALSVRFADGVGEIGEGALQAPSLTASLRGGFSLTDRTLRARAELSPRLAGSRPGPFFDLAGPWEDVAVRVLRSDEPDLPASALTAEPLPGPALLPARARAYAP